MQTYQLQEDINVTGVQVTGFPAGIEEAFGELMKTFGAERDYYGISWCDESGAVQYYAMTADAFPGSEQRPGYVSRTIPKGTYITEAIHDWRRKTDCIKDVFQQMLTGRTPREGDPCIEWYQSDQEMLCMVKAV